MEQSNALPDSIRAAIEAHGGAARWAELAEIEATVSACGLLFTAKRRPILRQVQVRASTHEPRFAFNDFPHVGETSELQGEELVRVVGRDGAILARRDGPRTAFRGWRRQIYWDDLDFVYFGAYAFWNYLTAPFLFLRGGFTFQELPPLATSAGIWPRIRATFPSDIPTHSRVQDFYFDRQHRLCRIDYTAMVIGRWARAAHICEDFREFDGFLIPTRRTVKPLPVGNAPLPAPTLVAIEVHDFRPRPYD
ncbi:hypothetical protein [Paraburkholderia sp. Clong3]|uniref:hypothetical protein n=1 Tax=Paraburkholderia sp. Clong3 TaxID=2991061 RepID=UPI003D20D443